MTLKNVFIEIGEVEKEPEKSLKNKRALCVLQGEGTTVGPLGGHRGVGGCDYLTGILLLGSWVLGISPQHKVN